MDDLIDLPDKKPEEIPAEELPPKAMLAIIRFIDHYIGEWSGRLFAWFMIPLIGSLVYEVFARYLFNAPTIWAIEVTYQCYAAHFMLGELYRQRAQENDVENALRAYEKAARCNPAYANAYRGLGQIYYKKNQKEKARQAFENYLTLNPDAEDAPYIRYYLKQLDPHRQEKEK